MHFSSTQPREELKTHGCLDVPSTPAPPLAPLHRPTSPDAALPQYLDRRLGGEDEHGTAAVANPPSASTPGQFRGRLFSSSRGGMGDHNGCSQETGGKGLRIPGALEEPMDG